LKNCDVPPATGRTFFKTGIDSKYLVYDSVDKIPHGKIKNICQYWDLAMAEISSVEDYKQLINAFNSKLWWLFIEKLTRTD